MKGDKHMSMNPTNYHKPLDPTQAVRYNPYAPPSPYGTIPMPPPPPATSHRVRWIVLTVCIIAALALLGGVLFAVYRANTAQPSSLPTAKTALAIFQDLQQAGLQAIDVKSHIADCWVRVPAGLVSTVCFRNVDVCNLSCDEDMVSIAVFDNVTDAQAHYQLAVQATGGPYYPAILEGHCVLDGIINDGKYVQVLKNDC